MLGKPVKTNLSARKGTTVRQNITSLAGKSSELIAEARKPAAKKGY